MKWKSVVGREKLLAENLSSKVATVRMKERREESCEVFFRSADTRSKRIDGRKRGRRVSTRVEKREEVGETRGFQRVATVKRTLVLVNAEGPQTREDWIAREEPLEIRVKCPGEKKQNLAVVLRTPGHDDELAIGFLFGEHLIQARDDVVSVGPSRLDRACNVVEVELSRAIDLDASKRRFASNSSCGLCGKTSIDQISTRRDPVGVGPTLAKSVLIEMPARLREAQGAFDRTGGLHAAGIFDDEGHLLGLREDVGRHNAVDKLVGRGFLDETLPMADKILLVSGRAGFEIVQKAAAAGVTIVCAVSAPSSLAVGLADRVGLTLVGFLRGSSFNIYTHAHRIRTAF